ncbi:MAG: S-layer homology domain-containing protein [Clostridia bacterium]|nr:S-layer homology domain-containing protein [Clostridia bacterium]
MKKRILAAILCVIMTVCALPIVASAATYIDYNYGVTIETPHPGRNPDYSPMLADPRFTSVETFWFDMSGYEYNKVQPTDTFVEGKDYLLILRFRYNSTQYTCNNATVSYINYSEQYPTKIVAETSTVSYLELQASFKCKTATLTGSNSPKVTITAPVDGAYPSTYYTTNSSYNVKFNVGDPAVNWYKIDPSLAELDANGNLKSNEDAFKVLSEEMSSIETFHAGYCYAAVMAITPATGYTFDSNTSFSVNGVLMRGIYSNGVISAMRLFYCPGTVNSVVIKNLEAPVAGKFANPFFDVPIGDTFGRNTILSSFSSAEEASDGDLEIHGKTYKIDESNIQIFECGKNYLYGIWDGYSTPGVTLSDKAYFYVNDTVGDAYTVLGNSIIGYKLYKNIKCDAAAKFTDMRPKSHWAHNALDFAFANGYISGTSATTISPGTALTRAMVVQILYAYEGSPKPEGKNPFTDVVDGSWYANAVIWASSKGIVNGIGDGKFNPNGKLSREQLALILQSFAKYKGMDTTKTTELTGFSDQGSVSGWAKDAVKWAVAEGLIAGSAGKVMPKGDCTREQFAVVLRAFVLAKDCPATSIIGNQPQ